MQGAASRIRRRALCRCVRLPRKRRGDTSLAASIRAAQERLPPTGPATCEGSAKQYRDPPRAHRTSEQRGPATAIPLLLLPARVQARGPPGAPQLRRGPRSCALLLGGGSGFAELCKLYLPCQLSEGSSRPWQRLPVPPTKSDNQAMADRHRSLSPQPQTKRGKEELKGSEPAGQKRHRGLATGRKQLKLRFGDGVQAKGPARLAAFTAFTALTFRTSASASKRVSNSTANLSVLEQMHALALALTSGAKYSKNKIITRTAKRSWGWLGECFSFGSRALGFTSQGPLSGPNFGTHRASLRAKGFTDAGSKASRFGPEHTRLVKCVPHGKKSVPVERSTQVVSYFVAPKHKGAKGAQPPFSSRCGKTEG